MQEPLQISITSSVLAIDALLYHMTDLVMHRIQVGTVQWSQVWCQDAVCATVSLTECYKFTFYYKIINID